MKTISFIKMHGLGNDFVLIDALKENMEGIDLHQLARSICDRHFGVGADQLLLVLPSQKADYRMRIFNPDGSEAEMCGNGIRCFAKYVYETSKEKKELISVETEAGVVLPAVILAKSEVVGAEVDMGEPRDLKEISVAGYRAYKVSLGNPHCVIFIEDISQAPVATIGPVIEKDPQFPGRTNVEFVEVNNNHEITVRVWERGAGETLACGTGACAAVAAGVLTGKTQRRVLVHLPGGNLDIEWEEEDKHVAMRGPAATVFEGKYALP
jgi:diaminopimelate epimerase